MQSHKDHSSLLTIFALEEASHYVINTQAALGQLYGKRNGDLPQTARTNLLAMWVSHLGTSEAFSLDEWHLFSYYYLILELNTNTFIREKAKMIQGYME